MLKEMLDSCPKCLAEKPFHATNQTGYVTCDRDGLQLIQYCDEYTCMNCGYELEILTGEEYID